MALKRMDNVGIVVDDLGGTIDFFRELGLELEGRTIEGEWAGRFTGLGDQRVEIASRNLALLFEVVINAIRKAAPGAAIAFNTRPDDSADAAARWVTAGSRAL